MNQETLHPEETGAARPQDAPELVVERRRGFSIVWLIPLVAALVGGWLAYTTLTEKGPSITITFKEGTGVEAGKTKVTYKALEVGMVESVRLSEDLSHVIVTANLSKDVKEHLREGTQFWVVRPRVGLSGVTGLETLVSGTYIEVEFGEGKPQRTFTGLEQPPAIPIDTPGRQFLLLANKLGSLQHGSPIYYRDIRVGEVSTTELAEDNQNVRVAIFINAPYHQLVRDNSRFWRTSGLDVSLGAQGINVKMESLLALLAGGITFETPVSAQSQPSADGAQFRLYDTYAGIAEASFDRKDAYVMYFDGSVRGLDIGAPVEIRGIKIGAVTDVALQFNAKTSNVRIAVTTQIEPERILDREMIKQMEQLYSTAYAQGRRPAMEKLVEQGLRAQLKTGSLLTGQLYVDLDFFPNSPPQPINYSGRYPEIPTVPSTLDAFQKSVADILTDLRKLPLDKIANELLSTIQGANRLVNSPELIQTIRSLDATLQGLQKLSITTSRQIDGLASDVDKTLKTVQSALQIAAPGSPVMVDLASMLKELTMAARSIRVLADYLERNPQALLRGKSGPGGY